MSDRPQTMTTAALPAVPLTLEGAPILHQMFRIRWAALRRLEAGERQTIITEAAAELVRMESAGSALFSMLGHKGDLMFVHFRRSFDELGDAQLQVARLALSEYLEPTTSYVSVVELGLYESTVKLQSQLVARGVEPESEEWEKATSEMLAQQARAMHPRLWPDVPPRRFLCFYPMDKKRGEEKNWYSVPMRDRQRMMQEHGLIGRKYAGTVKQIISGSIGFDDWEWGVDLFADDPLVFKRLIYEMRFDEASAVYALFGSFYIGMRFTASDFPTLLEGKLPSFESPSKD
jgi:chlorite dismutase